MNVAGLGVLQGPTLGLLRFLLPPQPRLPMCEKAANYPEFDTSDDLPSEVTSYRQLQASESSSLIQEPANVGNAFSDTYTAKN